MAEDREVAGIRCMQVLARLSEYLDESLTGAERSQIDDHLRSCTWCEQFGGAMGQVVRALRMHLGQAERAGVGVVERLAKALDLPAD